MSLPWFFAVDHLASGGKAQLLGEGALDWQNAQDLSASGGRMFMRTYYNTGANTSFLKLFPALNAVAIGHRYSGNGNAGNHFSILRETASSPNRVSLMRASGVEVQAFVNGVAVGGLLPANTAELAYYEVAVRVHATEGWLIVRRNGVTLLSLTGINTKGSGGDTLSAWYFGSGGANAFCWNTDLYIREPPSQAAPFYGPILLRYLRPVSDDVANWPAVGSGAGNWGRVADANGHDGNTSYIESNVLGTESVLNMADLPAGVDSIIAVVPVAVSLAPSGGAPQIELGLTTGAGTLQTEPRTVGVGGYTTQMGAAQTQKPGGGGWSIAAVDELKLRIRAA
jgi:hypothetical protein